MITAEEMEPAGHVHVNAGRLWAGGIATAIVAALAVLAGVLITRGVLGIPVLAPKAASDFGDSSTAVYAGLAAGCALLATALLHVLLLGTPRPFMFFAWITGLADVIAAAAPFTQPAPLASKIFAICSLWISALRDSQNDSSTATPISALAYSDSPRLPSMLSTAGRTEVLM
jgi:hypothetical protein